MAHAAQATSLQVELATEELVGRTEALLTQGQLLEAVELYLQAAERKYHTHLECSRKSPAVISSRKKFADSFVTVLGIFLDGLDCGGDPNAMQQFSLLGILSISTLRNNEVVLAHPTPLWVHTCPWLMPPPPNNVHSLWEVDQLHRMVCNCILNLKLVTLSIEQFLKKLY